MPIEPNTVHIDEDGTIYNSLLFAGRNADEHTINPEYIVATRLGHDRKTFWILSTLLAIAIGLCISIIIRPIIMTLFPNSPMIILNEMTHYLLCAASIYGSWKYYARHRHPFYTKSHYWKSARSSFLSATAMLIWLFIGLMAMTMFIIAAVFFIVAKAARAIFKG